MPHWELFDNLHNPAHVNEKISVMPRPSLPDLTAFQVIATHRSFRKAATELGVSASALSHTMRGLEEQLGVRLLHRTTRSVALTEAGQALLARLQPALWEIQDALDSVNAFRETPRGTLRLNVPSDAARFLLAPKLAGFLATYPDVQLELISDDHLLDIVAHGFDAGIRCQETLPQDMVAIPFGQNQRFVVVASPAFCAQYGVPQTPPELMQFACIRRRFPNGELYHWEFARGLETCAVNVQGSFTASDSYVMREAALQGLGFAYLLEQHVTDDVKNGRLVQVLADYCPADAGFFLYYPSRKQLSASLRALIAYWKTA